MKMKPDESTTNGSVLLNAAQPFNQSLVSFTRRLRIFVRQTSRPLLGATDWKSVARSGCGTATLNESYRAFARLLILLVVLITSSASVFAMGESVESFVKLKSKWEELVGSKFLLQGRVSGTTDYILGLQGCSIEFRSKEKLPRFDVKKDVLEVSGELARDERTNLIYFKLSSIKKLESDDRLFERQKLGLLRNDPQKWYELGNWAVQRGTFYKDNELIQKGKSCFEEALRIERSTMQDRTPERLLELGRKANELTGNDLFRQQVQHEATNIEWTAALKGRTTADELLGLAEQLGRKLPGSDQKLTEADLALRDAYMQAPIETYDSTLLSKELSPEQRTARLHKIHRVIFSELVLESAKRRLKKDGSNGKAVAAELLRLLPEQVELATKYREAEYSARLIGFSKLSFSEMTALRKELSELGRVEESKDLHLKWFANRDEVLRKQTAAELVELAALYHVGYEGPRDKRRIVLDLLFEAEGKRPGIPDAKELFGIYGYRQYEGRWLTEAEISAQENSPIALAIREGRVIAGMSPQQVRRVLGTPTSVTKFVTPKQVTEYWVYRDSRFSVKLTRPASRPDAVVAGVEDLTGQ